MLTREKPYALERSPLYRLQSRSRLAGLLFISRKELKRLSGDVHLYKHFHVTKKDKSLRPVVEPRRELKAVQRSIVELLARIMPPDFLFCPVKRRSHIGNAEQHRDSRVVHSLDVKKYFPNTPSRRVYWFFRQVMGCSSDVAAVLAKVACCEGHLPTGSPLSPIMAYYAHKDIWEEVAGIARENDCVVTVYIDDVTVSGAKVPKALVWKMKQVIHGGGLRYHKEKRAVDRPCEVTGVVLRDGEMLVANRHRDKLRKLKQAKDRERGPKVDKSLLGQLAGMQGMVDQVRSANRIDDA
jgi:Reverse transcriptase (RNA-dependent DNA polymerase)